jgi:ADP-heptose:LPS heptosyltransferase
VPAAARAAATNRLAAHARPWIGIHASGGRESKQWHPDRFARVGRVLAQTTGGTLVLTGGPSEEALVANVSAHLAGVPHVTSVNTGSLRDAAAVLASLDVFITGDTGPMHLAAAVGTPVVALFGPSNPARYGPRAPRERIVRIDLPCSPCGQVRLPPERCRGHVPDCLDGITVDTVIQHALDLLAGRDPASISA